MGNFARALHHLDMKDVKKKRLEEIAAQKLKEKKDREEKKIIQEISKKYKSDWKREIYEGMNTSNAQTITVAPAEGDGTVTAVDAIDASSYSGTVTGLIGSDEKSGNTGSVIRDSGSGSGQDGGFNVGGKYLSFQGDGYNVSGHAIRWAALSPIDSSRINSLTITAIVGNDSNGGEDPDATLEDLRVMYKTSSMSSFAFLNINPNGPNGATDSDVIIPLGASGNSGLNNYSVKIPEYARGKNTEFVLIQTVSSGTGFDNYGITDIKFQRTTPVNVVVPLDDPQAISFVRVGSDEGDPKKRKKKLNDQLAASDEYTQAQLGDDFPGGGARVGGDDPFASAKIGDDVKPSPIGKAEVKKSFSTFSTDTAVATATNDTDANTTQVVTTPSTQTTMNPTNDEGEEITVKTVGGKNSGVIQGADAANVDAQNDQDDAQEPEPTEPEPTEPEPELDPEELKASEQEKQDKTPEEVEEIEREKYEAEEQKQVNKILDKLLDFVKQIDPLDMPIDLGIDIALGIIRLGKGVNQIRSFLKKLSGGRFGSGSGILIDPDEALASGRMEKFVNNIEIMRSNLTGRITTHDYSSRQISDLANSLTVDKFDGGNFYAETDGSYGISDVRHEYVDDNIYVLSRPGEPGKVYTNDQGLKSLANMETGVRSIDGIGKGYGQMIIPKDGSKPYFHFYDYNYHNLNSSSPTELPDDFITKFGAQTAQVLRSFLPGRIFDDVINRIQGNLDTFGKNLKTRVGLDGWPPGIHGATLTDFKIPLDQLPKETQEMIANHPLSWTPDRIANMKEDDWIDEMQDRIQPEDYENFDETMLAAMKDPDTGSTVDPEYLEKYQRFFPYSAYDSKTEKHIDAKEGTVQYDYDKAVEELRKARENPDYDKATQAAFKEYEDILAEQDKKIDEVGEKYDTGKLWDKLVGPYYRAVEKIIKSGGSVGDENPTYRKMKEGHKEYEKQRKIFEKKRDAERSALLDEYGKLSDEAYARYEDTFQVKKLDDGTTGMVNGGDFKTKSGKVIPGKRTLTAKEVARFDEVKKEYDEVQEYIYSNEDYMDNMYIPYVLYDVKTGFGKYDISGDSWTPTKKGSGERSQDKPEQPKPDPRSGYAGLDDPIIGLGAKDGDKIAGNYPTASEQQILQNQLNSILKGQGKAAAKREQERLMRMYGIYFPLASEGGGGDVQVAHYQPKGNPLFEKYARPQPKRDLFERLKQKQFFNPNDIKPTFPENPPPQLDPKTGMHPNYGKHAKRYRKLDPASANAMPPTGDPETDAIVDKQRTKPKTKLYDRLKKNIRKDLTNK